MPEIVIRRSGGKGWGGFVIAAVVLMVLGFARYGPKLARNDAQHREELERQRVQQIIETTTSEDMQRLRRSLEESGAVEKSLENMRRAVEAQSQAHPTETSKPIGPSLPADTALDRASQQ
jgi:hypothetical protein